MSHLDAIDHAMSSLYRVISFSEGEEPDWEGMTAVFHPAARLTRVTPEGTDFFDLVRFQAMCSEMLDIGVYTSFHEREIARDVRIFGSLAHVLSAFETKRSPEASLPLSRGVNSVQLLWQNDRWSVLHLLWDEESVHNPLALGELFSREAGYVPTP